MDEKRLQAWLDGALDAGEAERFLAALPEAERKEALALAEVVRLAERLPRAAPSEDFTSRAMARVRARRPPRRSFWTWLRTPAFSPLASAAGALAAAAVCALVLTRGPVFTARGTARGPAAGEATVLARLVLRAPDARDVAVAADFNGWNPSAARMRRGEGGLWTIEIPLAPGRRYQYMFVVDGQWRTDPDAPMRIDDGFGGVNAVLDL
jgi:hypothetical protein